MGRVIFHIGYPKTGTTTLQRCFLSYPGVHYLGQILRNPHANMGHDPRAAVSIKLIFSLLSADTRRFSEALPELRQTISDLLKDGRPVIVSDEALTLAEHMKIARMSDTSIYTDHATLAERLHRLWPGATVLVSIREQKALLCSFYLQQLRTDLPFISFERYVEQGFEAAGQRSILNAMRFDEMFSAYSGVFHKAQVKLMTFESYKNHFASLMVAMADAADIPSDDVLRWWDGRHDNARGGRHWHAQWLHRVLSKAKWRLPDSLYHGLQKRLSIVPARLEIERALASRLDAFFATSNARLEAAAGIKLSQLGYAVNTLPQSQRA